jgi:hypothetical protein
MFENFDYRTIEPAAFAAGSNTNGSLFLPELLHGEDQVIVIVVRACGARRRCPLIAELRPHSLQASGWKRERSGQTLCSGLRGHDRLDQSPRGAIGIGRVIKVEGVRRVGGRGPDRCRHLCRGRMRERAATSRRDYDAIVGFIRVENPAGAIGAGIVDRIRLIRFRSTRHVIASQQQGRTRVTRTAGRRALRSLQRRIVDRGLRRCVRRDRQGKGRAVA